MPEAAGQGTSFLLDCALKRVLVLARQIHHLRHFVLCDLIGEDPADADAAAVHKLISDWEPLKSVA